MSKPSCFIIMPISTPTQYIDQYNGDTDHFIHVLDQLFVPAIEAAGMAPIRPIVEGSEVIHGEIIRHLTEAELVLCDMTIFNPNVFFELGIRTALDKPISMVKDNYTDKTPFDLAPVNYHQYDSSLTSWVIEAERERLKDHIEACRKNGTDNPIWKYFGITGHAEAHKDSPDVNQKLDYMIKQVDSLRQKTDNIEDRTQTQFSMVKRRESNDAVSRLMYDIRVVLDTLKFGQDDFSFHLADDKAIMYTERFVADSVRSALTSCCKAHGYQFSVIRP